MTASQPDWIEIVVVTKTQDAVAEICDDAGIERRELDSRRKRESWRRLNPRPFPPRRRAAATSSGVVPDEGADATLPDAKLPDAGRHSPADRRRLLDRLVLAISMKLEQLERRMRKDLAAADETPATDHERETRAIGTLIDNLEKITEIETGLGKSVGGADAATDLADEADRWHRELAERLARIVDPAARGA